MNGGIRDVDGGSITVAEDAVSVDGRGGDISVFDGDGGAV
jgi:hypothetical protein